MEYSLKLKYEISEVAEEVKAVDKLIIDYYNYFVFGYRSIVSHV